MKKCGSAKVNYLSLILFISLPAFLWFAPSQARAEERTVTVGVYENAPKVFTSESGKPAGIFIDVIEQIAKSEGWKLRYVSGTWADGLDRVAKGEIDLMPDVAYTAEREKIYSFHKIPVLSVWSQVYAPRESGIQSILDLNGKRVAALEQTIQLETFRRLTHSFELKITLVPVPDYKTEFEMIANGKVDAGVTNRFYGLMYARRYGLEDTPIMFDPAPFFFAAPKNDPQKLLDIIDSRLSELKKDPQSAYYASIKHWTSEEVRFKWPVWLRVLGFAAGVALLVSVGSIFVFKRQLKARTRELKRINEDLRFSERRYRELVENANSIILRWTRDGRITFLNEFGQRFFGYSGEEIIGRHVMGTLVPGSGSDGRDLCQLMDQICADPVAFEQNVNENIKRSGERVWISWTNKIVQDVQGQVVEIMSIGTDVTERKRAEEAILELNSKLEQRVAERTAELAVARDRAEEADHLKSAFLATMSHELRTPLNSIIGFTGIILQELAGPLNTEQRKQLEMVRDSARHLLALINDVLDISKIEAGQLEVRREEFDLRAGILKIVEIVKPMAEKKGLALRAELAPDLRIASLTACRTRRLIFIVPGAGVPSGFR
jgi:PAS domain S-box-containing protein